MKTRVRYLESPRTSARFPNLSSSGWRDVRRDPVKAKTAFGFFYERLKPAGVFNKLTLTQRVELVALVARLQGRRRDWRDDHYVRRQFKRAKNEAPRRIRMLQSKLRHVVKAFGDLADYVEPLRVELLGEIILGIGLQIPREERIPSPEDLRAEAARYEHMRPATEAEIEADIHKILDGESAGPPRAAVRTDEVSELANFLVAICGLSQADADVRTGKITNIALGSDVKVIEHRRDADVGRGSEAIRARRRRAKKVATTKKKS
jgi:hypothetical protein